MSEQKLKLMRGLQSLRAAIESEDIATMRAAFKKQAWWEPITDVDIFKFALSAMGNHIIEELEGLA